MVHKGKGRVGGSGKKKKNEGGGFRGTRDGTLASEIGMAKGTGRPADDCLPLLMGQRPQGVHHLLRLERVQPCKGRNQAGTKGQRCTSYTFTRPPLPFPPIAGSRLKSTEGHLARACRGPEKEEWHGKKADTG